MKIHYTILVIALLALAACANPEPKTAPPPNTVPVTPAAESCADSIKNQAETDVDCGGPCQSCADGKVCANDADCTSKFCNDQHQCGSTSCTDGIWNGREEKADCGGPCPACPTCSDGVKNQDEQGVDCGGACAICAAESFTLSEEQLSAIKSKLKLNTKATFLTNSYPQGLKAGESVVFALGITNTLQYEENFSVKILFDGARDYSNNNIDAADPLTVERWFIGNDYQPYYSLEKYEQLFLPVGVAVGNEIGPGAPTVPGIYYFKALISYERTTTYSEYTTLDFSVKVD
jgi:hypothetical protein